MNGQRMDIHTYIHTQFVYIYTTEYYSDLKRRKSCDMQQK